MDLNQAFELVAKAAAGNAGALGRYGMKIDENLPKADQFAQALAKIDAAFGGAAESKVNTYAGALAQLGNAYNDVLENIGAMITSSPSLIALIKSLGEWFKGLAERVADFGRNRDVFGGVASAVLSFGQTLVTYVLAPLELLYNLTKLVFSGFSWGIQGIIVLVTSLGNGLVNLVVTPIQLILQGLAKVAGYVNSDYQAAIESAAQSLQALPDATKSALEATGAAWVDIGSQVKSNASNILNFDASLGASNMIAGVQQTIDSAKEPIKQAGKTAGQSLMDGFSEPLLQVNSISEAFSLGLTEVAVTAVDIAKTIQNALVQGFSNSFSAMGRALATGQNGFKEFGKQVLSTIGGLAIQLGQFFLLVGAGMSATGTLLGISGGAAIAAGIALTVLGGVLQGMGGGGSGGASASTSAAAGSATVSPDLVTAPDLENEQRPRTEVVVNVQGNILDRRESGLAIADILNEYFSANDGRIVAAV